MRSHNTMTFWSLKARRDAKKPETGGCSPCNLIAKALNIHSPHRAEVGAM